MGEDFFFVSFVFLASAVIAVPIAKKLGLGSVLGYLLAGIAIGPYLLGLVGEEGQDIMHFAEFGVIMMLFLVGLELQPSLLWKLKNRILGLGGLQVLLSTALILILTITLTSFTWQVGLSIGLILALSSTAIVLQTLNEKGLMKNESGQNAFSVLLFQDIAVIPILAILPILATFELPIGSDSHSVHTWTEGLPAWLETIVTVGIVLFIVFAGKFLISPAFRLIANTKLRELFTAASLLLVIAITLLMTKVGLSPALGTFIAGVVLAQSEYRHELETDIEPFKGLLLGIFFIAVGASINFSLISEESMLIAQIVSGLIIIKGIVLFVIGKIFKMNLDSNLIFTLGLAGGGEFAFVLFSFAYKNGILPSEITELLVASVAISMALTPILYLLNEKLILPNVGTLESSKREDDDINEESKVIIAGFGRYGSTIGRFLQANDIYATYLDLDPDNVDLLRKLGFKVFYGDACRYDLLHAAGAHEADLLIIAVDDSEKALEIVETSQKHFPKLSIFSRTNGWEDTFEFLDKNIDGVYREYLDSSLKIGGDALAFLGKRKFQIEKSKKTFRRYDEQYLRELSEIRQEKSQYMKSAKEKINSLEKIIAEDKERTHNNQNTGWDTEYLKNEFNKEDLDHT